MVPATQVTVTSRAAFILTSVGAWAGGTYGFILPIWDEDVIAGALDNGWWSLLMLVAIAMLGAAVGGLIALCCGCRMSRQYCWLFPLVASLLVFPLGAYGMFRTVEAFPDALSWFSVRMNQPAGTLPLFGSILGGITLAVLLTNTRAGLGRRSRRAGIVAGVIALGIYVALEALWYHATKSHRPQSFFVSVPWSVMLTLGGFAVVAAMSLAAACYAERPVGRSYEVIPIARA